MKKHTLIAAVLALSLVAPPETKLMAQNSQNSAIEWNRITLNLIKDAGTPPPAAARNLAIVHLSMYEAVNSIFRTHQPYQNYIDTPLNASPEAAAITAAYESLVKLYPTKQAELTSSKDAGLGNISENSQREDGIKIGKAAAEVIWNLRQNDGYNATVAYTAQSTPGRWAPIDLTKPTPLYPHWGKVTPFSKTSLKAFFPPAPPALDSAQYAQDVNEVKSIGAKNSVTRTADQSEIALFWADGAGTYTPPGHWNVLASDLAQSKGMNLNDSTRLLAMLNLGMADAAILCWDIKYTYDFWRPYFAVRQADADSNPATTPDITWESFISTPNFPEYTSGHSTFSGTASVILSHFFTSNIPFTTYSLVDPSIRRSFTSFSAAAEEAAASRLYGGIHFRSGNQNGLNSGFTLGRHIVNTFFKSDPKSTPTPTPTPKATPISTPTPTMIKVNNLVKRAAPTPKPIGQPTPAAKVAAAIITPVKSTPVTAKPIAIPVTAETGADLTLFALPSILFGAIALRRVLKIAKQ